MKGRVPPFNVKVRDFGDSRRHRIQVTLETSPVRLLTHTERRLFVEAAEKATRDFPGTGPAKFKFSPVVEPVLYKKTREYLGRKKRKALATSIRDAFLESVISTVQVRARAVAAGT